MAVPQTRLPRELATREATERPKQWAPPSRLPNPDPEPGKQFHWVGTRIQGQEDLRNVSLRVREGWVPVKASEKPEIVAKIAVNESKNGNIELGGLMLCWMPQEDYDAMQRYFDGLANQKLQSVKQKNELEREAANQPLGYVVANKAERGFGNGF